MFEFADYYPMEGCQPSKNMINSIKPFEGLATFSGLRLTANI